MRNHSLLVMSISAMLAAAQAGAAPTGTIVGAAVGAAGGLVAANNLDHVDARWAVPVGILAGGIIGNQAEHWGRRHHHHHKGPAKAQEPAPFVPDLHPGVDLVKVSILNSNGTRSDIGILRVGARFVGPQGESYETLPSAETLRARYGM